MTRETETKNEKKKERKKERNKQRPIVSTATTTNETKSNKTNWKKRLEVLYGLKPRNG